MFLKFFKKDFVCCSFDIGDNINIFSFVFIIQVARNNFFSYISFFVCNSLNVLFIKNGKIMNTKGIRGGMIAGYNTNRMHQPAAQYPVFFSYYLFLYYPI